MNGIDANNGVRMLYGPKRLRQVQSHRSEKIFEAQVVAIRLNAIQSIRQIRRLPADTRQVVSEIPRVLTGATSNLQDERILLEDLA